MVWPRSGKFINQQHPATKVMQTEIFSLNWSARTMYANKFKSIIKRVPRLKMNAYENSSASDHARTNHFLLLTDSLFV